MDEQPFIVFMGRRTVVGAGAGGEPREAGIYPVPVVLHAYREMGSAVGVCDPTQHAHTMTHLLALGMRPACCISSRLSRRSSDLEWAKAHFSPYLPCVGGVWKRNGRIR